MNQHPLAGLEPQAPLAFFEEICSIPHGSYNTKQISDYLVRFAAERKLRYIQDSSNNVVIYKPGTPGYEDHPTVILQGHMDMVCEKDADCSIDFSVDGLDLTHDDTHIFARGTTLGGDDGIAVAFALALLDSDQIPHPPLEVLITVDEEVGMLGASALDGSVIQGRTLINLDSEDEGILTVSCAGGARANLKLSLPRKTVVGPCIRVVVDGLTGGHSGVEIHKNRANANKVLGTLLARIHDRMPICLTNINGGTKDNAITRSSKATFVAMSTQVEQINEIASALQQEIRESFEEPDVVISAESMDAMGGSAFSVEDSAKVIGLLNAVPNGVQKMSADIPGLVQTSLNLGILVTGEDGVSLSHSVRSSVNAEKDEILSRLRQTVEAFGGTYDQMGEYPAWEYRKHSPLRDLMVSVYSEMFGREPEVVAIHAGLECGLFSDKLPGLDCVSFGPQMQDIHTSREKLSIASTQRMWQYLLEILKRL